MRRIRFWGIATEGMFRVSLLEDLNEKGRPLAVLLRCGGREGEIARNLLTLIFGRGG